MSAVLPKQISARAEKAVSTIQNSVVTSASAVSILFLLFITFTKMSAQAIIGQISNLQLAVHILCFDIVISGPLT